MDNEPTALFETYENDFVALVNAVKAKLDGEAKDAQGGEIFLHLLLSCKLGNDGPGTEARKALIRRADMELDEADEMVYIFFSYLYKVELKVVFFLSRYRRWKLKSRACFSRLNPGTKPK